MKKYLWFVYFIGCILFIALGIFTIMFDILLCYNNTINEIIWVSAGILYLCIGGKLLNKSEDLIREERRKNHN